METIIEIYRVILSVYRKYGFEIGTLFHEGPSFHKQLGTCSERKELKQGFRFILGNKFQGLQYLETPFGRLRLHTSGSTEKFIAARDEIIGILGEEITHVGGKPVEVIDMWDMQKYDDEMRKHLHLIYDPEGILARFAMDNGYMEAKQYYYDELAKIYWKKYRKPYLYDSLLFSSPYKYNHLVGLSVALYNQI
jgi:hypothetical protein